MVKVLAGSLTRPMLASNFASFQRELSHVGHLSSYAKGPVNARHEFRHISCSIGSIPACAAMRSSTAANPRH